MSHRQLLVSIVAVITLSAACKVTVEDVRSWQHIEEGNRRIAAFVADSKRPLALRVEAAMLLVEMDEVYAMADALRRSPSTERTAIVSAVLPRLTSLLDSELEAEQGHAKDALFFVGGYLEEAERQQAAKALIEWAGQDFSGRYARGRTTLAQVLPALGTASVPGLLALLARGEAVAEITAILTRFESHQVQEDAAKTLVSLIDRLGPEAPADAWSYIDRFTTPTLVPFLISKLADPKVPVAIKDAYFYHVVRCGGPGAAPGLAGLLSDHDLRWIAVQHILTLEKLDGLRRVLGALPALDDGYEDGELYDEVHFFCTRNLPTFKFGAAELQATLLGALDPERPIAALTAAHCLRDLGGPETVAPLQAIAGEQAAVAGWKTEEATLGSIATAAVETIEERLSGQKKDE